LEVEKIMKNKMIGIFACTLFITAVAFSVGGTDENKNRINYDNIVYTSEVSKPLN